MKVSDDKICIINRGLYMKIINEVISELANNEEFLKRLDDINKNEKNYEKAKSLTVKLINEYGYDLKESDITSVSPKTSRELSDDELTAVTGGVDCGCAFAGGSYGNDWFCSCICGGAGVDIYRRSCCCALVGAGTNLAD